jgi:hypothetical protein
MPFGPQLFWFDHSKGRSSRQQEEVGFPSRWTVPPPPPPPSPSWLCWIPAQLRKCSRSKKTNLACYCLVSSGGGGAR